MLEPVDRAALAAFFGLSAEPCSEALAFYIGANTPGPRFERQVRRALEALAGHGELDDAGIRHVRDIVSAAAATCRTGRPEAGLVAVAACFDGIVSGCTAALHEVDPLDQAVPWQRFLFADADVDVARVGRSWRVRAKAGGTAESSLLDAALGDVLELSSRRLGELTVQILDWREHDGPDPLRV